MYVCMYVCMYIYIHIYIYLYVSLSLSLSLCLSPCLSAGAHSLSWGTKNTETKTSRHYQGFAEDFVNVFPLLRISKRRSHIQLFWLHARIWGRLGLLGLTRIAPNPKIDFRNPIIAIIGFHPSNPSNPSQSESKICDPQNNLVLGVPNFRLGLQSEIVLGVANFRLGLQ